MAYLRPEPKNLRKPSTKNSGGQAGHKGHNLEAVANPDIIKSYEVTQCESCGANLESALADDYEEQQVFDIPLPKIEVTAH